MIASQHIIALTREDAVCTSATNNKVITMTGINHVAATHNITLIITGCSIVAHKQANHTRWSPGKRTKVTRQPINTTTTGNLIGTGTGQHNVVV